MNVEMPIKAWEALQSKTRYIVLYGGRGSAKSWSVARYLVVKALSGKFRILCCRQMQNSIKDSVHRLLTDQINSMGLSHLFDIKNDSIISKTGSEFLFKGIYQHYSELKSLEGINYVWCEESEKITEDSWRTLIPTVRAEGSQIIVVFNPDDEHSPTYKKFVLSPSQDCTIAKMNYDDNPWFPDVLRREMNYDKQNDFEKWNYIWNGFPKRYGQSVIFKDKLRVEDFDYPGDDMQYFIGADFGFTQDPTAIVQMFIKDMTLYIDHEFYGHGIEIEELPAAFMSLPAVKRGFKITADSARPDTISFLNNHGIPAQGAEKGKGSVEDGIEFLKSFEAIIIHPKCKGTIGDFSNYRLKTDRVTGDILPIPIDKSNHAPDACRYGLESWCKNDMTIFQALHGV